MSPVKYYLEEVMLQVVYESRFALAINILLHFRHAESDNTVQTRKHWLINNQILIAYSRQLTESKK